MTELIFPLAMTLLVTLIILRKEFEVTSKSITDRQRDIVFLMEPFIYSIFAFSWINLLTGDILGKILISCIGGIILFIIVTACFMPPRVNLNSKDNAYTPEELIGRYVVIKFENGDKRFLGELIGRDGERVDIVITSDDALVKNDLVKIMEIKGSDIIASKVNG